jgi:hypothetical protein
METPQSTVYLGREGTGAAQVFGREGNPMAVVHQRIANVERKEALEAERKRLAKQQRDTKMFEILNVSPEKTFEPFNKQVLDLAQQHREKVVEYFNSGGTVNPNFTSWNTKEWDRINDSARKGMYIQKKIGETMEEIKKNPYLDESHYYPKIWDHIMDEFGNGKPLDQVNIDNISSIYSNDPSGFNLDKYANDFYGNIKDNVFNWVAKRNTKYGTETDDVELKVKGKLYQPDETTTSGVKEDANGNPIVNVTSDVLNSFAESPLAKKRLEQMAQEQGVTPQEWIANRFSAMGGGFNKNAKPQSKMFPGGYYNLPDELGFKKADIPKATERMTNIGNILNAFWAPDGSRTAEPSPEARAALSYLIANAKFGDGEIIDADFASGTTRPGKTRYWDGELDNSADDRIVLRVKYSDTRMPKTESISLDEMNAGELNGLFNTAKTEGGFKVGYDQLRLLNEKTDNKLFQSRKDRSYSNAQTAAAEQQQVANWQEFKDLDSMKGKIIGGKKIAAVSVARSTGWWPSDEGINVVYSDGSKEMIKADQYDKLAEIHQAKKGNASASEEEEMVSVINPEGKKGSIRKSKLPAALKAGYKQVN